MEALGGKKKAGLFFSPKRHNVKETAANWRQVEVAPKFIEKAKGEGDGQRRKETQTRRVRN